jgi:hypothetical protein
VVNQQNQLLGFRGAHLMGSINHMAPDVEFPPYRDVDMHVIVDGSEWTDDLYYRGINLEYAAVDVARYSTPETVLADAEIASNLAVNSILLDPSGMLTALHSAVARDFARRKWVVARCNFEKRYARDAWEEARAGTAPLQLFHQTGMMVNFLAGLLAVASLEPPTHRRCLIVMGEILKRYSYPEVFEAVLDLWGVSQLDRADVESLLADCAEMFDVATAVTKTPVPFQRKLRPFVRPYIVDGAQVMIDQGYHREAMFWITLFLTVSNAAIQADAAEAERAVYQVRFDRFLGKVGWDQIGDLDARIDRAYSVMDQVFRIADQITEQNPRIVD